jgi:hypothetical protein
MGMPMKDDQLTLTSSLKRLPAHELPPGVGRELQPVVVTDVEQTAGTV